MLSYLTLLIVAFTIVGVAIGSWPFIRADRTGIVLIGAASLLALGATSLSEAVEGIDFDTLLLLFSMMVINACLSLAGFFTLVGHRVAMLARDPKTLLAMMILVSGVLSALFLNDTIVLMMTPIVIEVTRSLRRNPLPYLIGLAVSANIGSTATLTGNPQNMIIGNSSGIGYLAFASSLVWVALGGLVLSWVIIVWVYKDEFRTGKMETVPSLSLRIYRPLFLKSLVVIAIMLVAFLAGFAISLAAFVAAAVLLTTRRVRSERVFRKVDWGLLAFFAGLFVVTHALDTQHWTERLFTALAPIAELGMVPFGLVSVALSNLISNVPAVLLLQNLVSGFAETQRAWLTLAATSTLAGNLTLLGSVANLIMAEVARRNGIKVSFGEYLKVGIPVTVLTVLLSFLLV